MSDYRDLLDKERRRFAMRDGSLEGLEQRWNRKRRNARIAAGVLALLIAAAGVGGGLYAFRSSSGLKPGVSPSFSPPPSIGPAPSETPGVVSGRLSPPSGPIQFVDAQTGWAVGPSGEILFSTDAGRTWTGQYGGPLKIVALQFVDNLHGWALSEDGLLRTTTGGGHWGPAGSPEQPLRSVQFATDLVGWGVSGPSDPSVPGTLVKSTDGGISWKLLRTPMPVQSVCFADDGRIRTLWVAAEGPGPVLLKSPDEGETWSSSPLEFPGGESWTATLSCAGIDVWVLVKDGGAAGHQAYALYRTAEGGPGSSPVLQEAGTHPVGEVDGVVDAQDPYPGPFVAFDRVKALFIGWCPPCDNSVALYRSATGWTRAELVKEGATPLGMSFADRDHGWLLLAVRGSKGEEWTVMSTSDGGATWSTVG